MLYLLFPFFTDSPFESSILITDISTTENLNRIVLFQSDLKNKVIYFKTYNFFFKEKDK